jgi:hypothetical protein
MTEPTPSGQVPVPGAGQEPPITPPPTQAGQSSNLVDVTAMDARGLLQWFPAAYVAELRQEAAAERSRLRDAQRELDALRAQTVPVPLSPAPALPTGPAPVLAPSETPAPHPLEAETRRLRIENAVLAAAARDTEARARFIDPADAVRLADLSTVQPGADGVLTGVTEALDALAKAKPHLLVPKGRGGVGLSATNPAGPGAGKPDIVQRIEARYRGDSSQAFAGGGVFSPTAEE